MWKEILVVVLLLVYIRLSIPQIVQTYSFTGNYQTFTVPSGVTSISVTLSGAGSNSDSYGTYSCYGGYGAIVVQALSVTPGQVLYVYVGGQGGSGVSGTNTGGWNGGGMGYSSYGTGGNGATDIRTVVGDFASRLAVAGGGGGCYNEQGNDYGGNGGLVGDSGSGTHSGQPPGGGGGSGSGGAGQGTGGNIGTLGNGGSFLANSFGAGGGGGYYGGGSAYKAGGGGGSSYVTGSGSVTGFNTAIGTCSITYYTPNPTSQPSRQPSSHPSSHPTRQPTSQPSIQPSIQPSSRPSCRPSQQPTVQPTRQPLAMPTRQPSSCPSSKPSNQPSRQPTRHPSCRPTGQPSGRPSRQPSIQPTCRPSNQPSVCPSIQPSNRPSRQPSHQPTNQPTSQPSSLPTRQPSSRPSAQPSEQPSSKPSAKPSGQPSVHPSKQPSNLPSRQPSGHPSNQPTCQPIPRPTSQPSSIPSRQPASKPSGQPTMQPSCQPSIQPSCQPTYQPIPRPTSQPSSIPTRQPASKPSAQPTMQPSCQPSIQPSCQPTRSPTSQPSSNPSKQPLGKPSNQPTTQPSFQPSIQPSSQPSSQPSRIPSSQPTSVPSEQPTSQPSIQPTNQPSCQPISQPSRQPIGQPSVRPSNQPSGQPVDRPTSYPSSQPSSRPSCQPTLQPSRQPNSVPSTVPSKQPYSCPSAQPTASPTRQPSAQPASRPSSQPTVQPSSSPSTQPSCHPTSQPFSKPSTQPVCCPTSQPSSTPSNRPSIQPSSRPSIQPYDAPSSVPTSIPSCYPTVQPSRQPSVQPIMRPSSQPSSSPSRSRLVNQSISVIGELYQTFKKVIPFPIASTALSGATLIDVVLQPVASIGSYVLFGNTLLLPSIDVVSSLVQSFSGAGGLDSCERSVSVLGDVNGDGYADIIIGDPFVAKCFVLFGTKFGLVDMSEGFTIFGESEGDLTGWSVSAAGDVNNDTISDFIIGAPNAKGVGAFYVIYGRKFNEFDVHLNDLTETQGFVMYGATKSDFLGISVSNAGDVNGDKCDDVIIGGVMTSEFCAGAAYLIYGGQDFHRSTSIARMSTSQGIKLSGESYQYVGSSVSAVGDFNGDGYDDLIIGSSPTRSSLTVSAFLIYGSVALNDITLATLTADQGICIVGAGEVVSAAGDVNGDGYDDVMIGSIPNDLSNGLFIFTNISMLTAVTRLPTTSPTLLPTIVIPSLRPTRQPSVAATWKPSRHPNMLTVMPSPITVLGVNASIAPSIILTDAPTVEPTIEPSEWPSVSPTMEPSEMPTKRPEMTPLPSNSPTNEPSVMKTAIPSAQVRSPFSVPTCSPSTRVSSPPSVNHVIDGRVRLYNDSESTSSTHYLVNSTESVEIDPSKGKCTYGIVPVSSMMLTIVRFNVSTDLIDLILFTSIHKYADLNITAGSVIVTLSPHQVIHIMDQEPSTISEKNFIFAPAKINKPDHLATAMLVLLVLVILASSGAVIVLISCRMHRIAKERVAASFSDREFIGKYDTDKNGEYIFATDEEDSDSNESVDLSDHTIDSNGEWRYAEDQHSVGNSAEERIVTDAENGIYEEDELRHHAIEHFRGAKNSNEYGYVHDWHNFVHDGGFEPHHDIHSLDLLSFGANINGDGLWHEFDLDHNNNYAMWDADIEANLSAGFHGFYSDDEYDNDGYEDHVWNGQENM